MPREKPDFRDNLEFLNQEYPGLGMLEVAAVKKVTGWTDTRTIKKYLPIVGGRVPKVALAKLMSV